MASRQLVGEQVVMVTSEPADIQAHPDHWLLRKTWNEEEVDILVRWSRYSLWTTETLS